MIIVTINAAQTENFPVAIKLLAQDSRLREMSENNMRITTIVENAIATVSLSREE